MKKLLLVFFVVVILHPSKAQLTQSMREDIQSMSELMCEIYTVQDEIKSLGNDQAKKKEFNAEMEEMQEEYEDLKAEFESKYKQKLDMEKNEGARKIMMETLKECDSQTAKQQLEMLRKSMNKN